MEAACRRLLEHFMEVPRELFVSHENSITVPRIPRDILLHLVQRATVAFTSEPTMVMISGPTHVVGDIQGSLPDLLRILHLRGLPNSSNKYVFIGNNLAESDFCLDVFSLLLLLKTMFPSDVFILRANPGHSSLTSLLGFGQDIPISSPDAPLVSALLKLFNVLPLAALVDGVTLCLHSGIGPNASSVRALRNVTRPVLDEHAAILEQVLLFEPSDSVAEFDYAKSLFGRAALDKFLGGSFVDRLVRAHSVTKNGVDVEWDGKCVTLFSASAVSGHKAGIVFLDDIGNMHPIVLDPIDPFDRTRVRFCAPELPAYESPQAHMVRPGMILRNIGSVAPNLLVQPMDQQRDGIRLVRNRGKFQSLVLKRSKPLLGESPVKCGSRLRKNSVALSMTVVPKIPQLVPATNIVEKCASLV